LLVHADVQSSENGNCIEQDNTELLRIPAELWKNSFEQDQFSIEELIETSDAVDYDSFEEMKQDFYGPGTNTENYRRHFRVYGGLCYTLCFKTFQKVQHLSSLIDRR